MALSSSDQQWLLRLARRTLEALGPGAEKPEESQVIEPPVPDAVRASAGVFVSLHRGRELRGCIGYVAPILPIYKAVIANTVNAARSDPRFDPVEKNEVASLTIEISIMSVPREISGPAEIKIGRSGLIVESGTHRGLLLPQVATQMGWDAETFLSHTCRKAGLPMDAWRQPGGVHIQEFSAQVFSETHT